MKVMAWWVMLGMVLVALMPAMSVAHGADLTHSVMATGPVNINGNDALVAMANAKNWSGNGTAENPYIISGYDIDGNGGDFAFSVSNTNLYFVLENSNFTNAKYGVVLHNVKNAVLLGNNMSYNSVAGIEIEDSANVSLYANVMFGDGIWLSGSQTSVSSLTIPSNNTVNNKPVYYYANASSLTVPSNAGEVLIAGSTGITVSYQTASHGTVGVAVLYSSKITVETSTFLYMTTYGIYVYSSSNITLSDDQCGFNAQSGIFITGSSNVEVLSSASAYNTNAGIYFDHSSGNLLRGGNYYNNSVGLEFSYSNDNTVINGEFYNNSKDGVYISHSSNNVIKGITTWGNTNGIYVDTGPSNTFYGNALGNDGMFITGDRNTLISQVIPNNNTVGGKSLLYYANQDLNGAIIGSGAGEIILAGVSNAIINGVTFSGKANAIEIAYSQRITVENGTFSGVKCGVYLLNSIRISVLSNSFTSFSYSVYLQGANYSVVSDNTMYNGTYGAYMVQSNYNLVNNNTFSHNGVGVVLVYYSNWNVIERNNISYSVPTGVFVITAYYNIIRANIITYSNMSAIWIMSGSYNVIYNNTFFYNNNSGSTYNASHIQAEDDDAGNLWNITGYGNYWYDWANNNNTNYNITTGIVKWPYVIYNGETSGSSPRDYKPLKFQPNAKVFVPSAPTELTAQAGGGYVLISWGTPIDNGGSAIKSYRIYRNGALIATVPAYQHSFNDTGVNNGQTYVYYVVAVNSVGGWFKSNTVQATPGGEVPEFSSYAALILLGLVGIVVLRRRTR